MAKKNTKTRKTVKAPAKEINLEGNTKFYIIILILFWVIFFRELLVGNAYIFDDFLHQFYPQKFMSAVSLSNGEFPFWNPYTFGGMPFFAHIEIAVLYPVNILLVLFVKNGALSPLPIQISILGHYLLCSISSFFLGKQLKLGNVASAILGILFPYSSYMMIHAMHMANIEAVSWLPLVFLFWLKFIDDKKFLYIFIAAFLMSLSILCGYPQVAFFNYLFISVFVLIVFISKIRQKEKSDVIKISVAFLIFLLLPLGITAIQLLPTNEFVSISNRASFDYEFAKEGSFHPYDFLTAFMPKIFGVWNWNEASTDMKYWAQHQPGAWMFSIANVYISVLVIVVLIPFLRYLYNKKENLSLTGFLSGFGIFVILFALGGNFFLHRLLFETLPLFNRFRNPGHILYLYCFCMTILIAIGFDSLMKDRKGMLKYFTTKYFILLISVFSFFFILLLSGSFQSGDLLNNEQIYSWIKKQYTVFYFLLIAFGGLIVLFLKEKIKINVFIVLIIAVLCADIYINWYNQNNGTVFPDKTYDQNKQMIEQLKGDLNNEQFRINMRDGSNMIFQRNQGMRDRIPLIEGYGALLLERYYPFNKPNDPNSTQSHDLLNVKYKINVDKEKGTIGLVLNPGYLSRASMYYDIKTVDEDKVREYMDSDEFDYRKTLVLERTPLDFSLPEIKDTLNIPTSNVRITNFELNRINLDVETSENGFLLLSEVYYPAWKAYADGKETEIFRTDYSMRSIYLEKGNHKVEFVYESDTFKTGMYITFISLGLFLVGIVFLSYKKL
ncbi:YfhO family protein [Bacteroidota bacterium]